MQMRGTFPETFVSVLCVHKAPPSRSKKSLAPASARRNLRISVAARELRRLFGPRGGTARQDVVAATDVEVTSNYDNHASWAA